jgi:indole-3-glycerol phosphate synthase/phosphoribosylanthranilate isomerase
VRKFAEKIRPCHPEQAQRVEGYPLLVGVITETDSPEGQTAIKLAKEGVLDAVQFHGIAANPADNIDYAHYCAIQVGEPADFERVAALRQKGEPRILLDAKVEGIPGGTGKQIPKAYCEKKLVTSRFGLRAESTPTT